MKNYIIGVHGVKNSGKDTVASMINYIFAIGVTKASYQEWVLKRKKYDNTYEDRIIHFADPLKEVLSNIYNIPIGCFYDRTYKDEMYYNLKSGRFVKYNIRDKADDIEIVTIERLENAFLSSIVKNSGDKKVYIKLRTLMQYFGTNICRTIFNDNIWISSAITKMVDKALARRLCLVPDVRFNNEAEAIRNNDESLYGGVIRIIRPDATDTDSHESENNNVNCDYSITNDGTLMSLFYKVLAVVEIILNK